MWRRLGALVTGLALVSACSSGPDVGDVRYDIKPSSVYSVEDINDAAKAVVDDMAKVSGFKKLKSVTYTGELDSTIEPRRYGGDELIVLTVDFTTNSQAAEVGWNPDSEYDDFKMILVRDDSGPWRIVDGGYG